jgi:ATP-binding cassette subfamily B protein
MPFATMEYASDEKKEKIDYKSTFKLIYSISSEQRKDFVLAFLYLVFSTLFSLFTPILTKYAIDIAIKNNDIKKLFFFMSIYLLNSLLFLAFNYLSAVKLINTGQGLIFKLKNKIYKHLLDLDTDFYSQNPVGKIMARVQSDTSALYELFTETIVSIFKDILTFFAVFFIMYHYNAQLTRILFPIVIVIMLMVRIFIKKSSSIFVYLRKVISEISGFLSERLNFISTIQSFNREKQQEQALYDLNIKKLKTALKGELFTIFFFMTIIILSPISNALIFGYGGVKVLNNTLSIGVLIMFLLYIEKLFEPIFMFSEHISIIQKSFSAGHRLNNLLSMKPKIINYDNPLFLDSFNKEIRFENVHMSYEEKENWILKNISFKVEKGKSIAIVGKTGSGKTTITNLLLRFNDYQKGHIYIDDIELKKINIKSLRKLIGLIQQDIYLFPGTILDNLKLMDKDIDNSRIDYAIKSLQLEYFYKKHSLNKKITEKGNNISQGEKQIIALTRSMVLDQEILAMDEATSNIDPYTERMLTKAVKNIMKHKTLIIIAHRLSTIQSVDKIIFLNNGEIAEIGSHEELMSKKGFYYRYYSLQMGLL